MGEPSARAGAAEPAEGTDVVGLILADHREFERLFRELRNREADRSGRLREVADLLVAHAEAEEAEVYPALRRRAPGEAEEIEHSVEEHADGHRALLELLEVDARDVERFEEALEELVQTVTHHLDEEERDVLNAAREKVPAERRSAIGEAFLRARRAWLDRAPGDVETVRSLLDREGRRDRL